jgi:cytochrome c-type biogenesis protein
MGSDVGRYGNCLFALTFFVFVLHRVGVIPLSFSGPGQVGMKRQVWLAAFVIGFVFLITSYP